MGFNKMFLQKLFFASLLTSVNVSLISVCYVYTNRWYYAQIPLLLVFLFGFISVFLIAILSIFKKDTRLTKEQIKSSNICYFIPCYNQSDEEINNTMESFINQSNLEKHKKIYVVVCDGRKQGVDNLLSTDKILSRIVFPNSNTTTLPTGYRNDQQQYNEIQILFGETKNKSPYFVIIKNTNKGKRDSISIIRRLCLNFNKIEPDYTFVSEKMLNIFKTHMKNYSIESIEYIVGVDADTVFQTDCTLELLREIQSSETILASTGLVKVQFTADTIIGKLMECYQHVEYIAGQGLLRNQQNLTQQKINCLPGCLNITKVCEKTCGEGMLSIYMKAPTEDDHIFQWIRGTASEDRHSVMLLLKLYGDCHTTCTWDAQAVTSVPITPSVFLSQRKRWSLGSATHGLWMVFMDNIPIFERISSMVFVLTYSLVPYFMYSLISWLNSIVKGGMDKTFWILTGAVQIVSLYKLTIGIWLKLSMKERLLYFICYPMYYVCGPIVSMCTYFYSIYNMQDFGWGKTRSVTQPVIEVKKSIGLVILEQEMHSQQFLQVSQNQQYRNQVIPKQININDQVSQNIFYKQDSEMIHAQIQKEPPQNTLNFVVDQQEDSQIPKSKVEQQSSKVQIQNQTPTKIKVFPFQASLRLGQYSLPMLNNDTINDEIIKTEESTNFLLFSDCNMTQKTELDQQMKTRMSTAMNQKIAKRRRMSKFQE